MRSQKGYGFIRIVEGLSQLKDYEIYDFFENHEYWRTNLKLVENEIETFGFATWIYKRSRQGEFKEAVKLIWQQYQRDYQNYLNDQQG